MGLVIVHVFNFVAGILRDPHSILQSDSEPLAPTNPSQYETRNCGNENDNQKLITALYMRKLTAQLPRGRRRKHHWAQLLSPCKSS